MLSKYYMEYKQKYFPYYLWFMLSKYLKEKNIYKLPEYKHYSP